MTILEYPYYFGYLLKKYYSLKFQKHLPYKIISVGNITVGGAGKTPLVIEIAKEAKNRGYCPVILTRGYKGKIKKPCFIVYSNEFSKLCSDTSPVCLSVKQSGDEPMLMAQRLKDIPIVKYKNRYEGGIFAINNLKSINKQIIFILDDGFQHWRLYRDLDIVLIDGVSKFGNGRMLPFGRLREPIKSLYRANVIVITKIKNKSLSNELNQINPQANIFFAEHKILSVRDIFDKKIDLKQLIDKSVYAFCGIANPEAFKKTIMDLDVKLKGFKSYKDHYNYSEKDINYIQSQSKKQECNFLLTTEKDIVKIRELKGVPENILTVEIGFVVSKEFHQCIFDLIEK